MIRGIAILAIAVLASAKALHPSGDVADGARGRIMRGEAPRRGSAAAAAAEEGDRHAAWDQVSPGTQSAAQAWARAAPEAAAPGAVSSSGIASTGEASQMSAEVGDGRFVVEPQAQGMAGDGQFVVESQTSAPGAVSSSGIANPAEVQESLARERAVDERLRQQGQQADEKRRAEQGQQLEAKVRELQKKDQVAEQEAKVREAQRVAERKAEDTKEQMDERAQQMKQMKQQEMQESSADVARRLREAAQKASQKSGALGNVVEPQAAPAAQNKLQPAPVVASSTGIDVKRMQDAVWREVPAPVVASSSGIDVKGMQDAVWGEVHPGQKVQNVLSSNYPVEADTALWKQQLEKQKEHRFEHKAGGPEYFLAPPNASCSEACNSSDLVCDSKSLMLAAVSPVECKRIIESLNKFPKFGGTFPNNNAGCTYNPEGAGWYQVMMKSGAPECDDYAQNGAQRICVCMTEDGQTSESVGVHRRREHRRRRQYWTEANEDDTADANFTAMRESVEILDENLGMVENQTTMMMGVSMAAVEAIGQTRERAELQAKEVGDFAARLSALESRGEASALMAVKVLQNGMNNLSAWMATIEQAHADEHDH